VNGIDVERIAQATLRELGVVGAVITVSADARPGEWRVDIQGGRGPDTMIGDQNANIFEGFAGDDVLMADDPEGLAAAIVATLADPQASARRAEAARHIADGHRAEHVMGALDGLWERARAGGRRRVS